MKHFLKIIPIPICGMILGLASLGNLFKDYHLIPLGNFIGAISTILILLMFGKLFLLFEHTKQTLHDPIIASVSPTFTMALMVICTYFVPFKEIAPFVKFIWLCAVLFQIVLVFYFTYHHVIKADLSIEAIYPSWFIIYVGFGVITVTAGNFLPVLGKIFFWISLTCYAFLLPIIIKRIFFVKNMAHPTLPLIAILAAPGSLCLTGYLKNFVQPNIYLVLLLFVISQVLYFIVLAMLPHLLSLDFYPSYAAFTFPLVISATALFTTVRYFHTLGIPTGLLDALKVIECLIATGMILYVFGHYLRYLIKEHRKNKPIMTKELID
ncbi:exfoliative toxin A/B [Enterococcus sp. 10A9_DIV0425]|uniref:Exfoliative toxin A/B n=1 Tax=Candidatus Enterococcus wittei TaxID=1987383 RepID=A0A242JY20_9ENTE|nr:TDT family transporter [Enterococcus sp. 10A9_DIV0425]OTP10217.1 exfoliative toxin A/B [Enterococcus sp. 10A9_DIV0425]